MAKIIKPMIPRQCVGAFIVVIISLMSVLFLSNLCNRYNILRSRSLVINISTTGTSHWNANELPSSLFKDELHFIVGHAPRAIGCGGCDALNELLLQLKELGFHTFGHPFKTCPDPAKIESIVPSNRTLVFVQTGSNNFTCEHLFPNRSIVNVRWMLGPPRAKLKDYHHNLDDLVFSYGPSMIDGIEYKFSNTLLVLKNPKPGDETDISDELFYNKNRSGVLWTMRKGRVFHSKITYIHEHPGIPATNMERDNPINVSTLLKYEYFVSYDPLTYLTILAAMAGTVSVVYPVAGQTKEQWTSKKVLIS